GHIVNEIGGLVGTRSAEAIQSMIQAAWRPSKSLIASALSLATLLLGALGVLMELKQSLNKIWRLPPSRGWGAAVGDRLKSLGLILGVGFLMIVSLVISAGISAVGAFVNYVLPFPQ